MREQSKTERELREKNNEEVCQWIAGFNDDRGIGYRLLGQHELQRRLRRPDSIRSWIAIGISLIALGVSILFRLFN
jgi:hypothetical protein